MSTPTPINPYEAPQAETILVGGPLSIPESFLGKLAMGFRLFFGNMGFIAPLVLAIWLPAGFVIESIVAQSANPNDDWTSTRLDNVVDAFFGPLISGALIFVLAERLEGRRPRFLPAIQSGLGSWGRLFGARFVAGLLTMLGLIALIVPGIVLAVRYSMIDEAVVLEGAGVSESRLRSTDLARGRGWLLFFTGMLFFTMLLLASMGFALLQEFVPEVDNLWGRVAFQSILHIFAAYSTCVMILYYWEGTAKESAELGIKRMNLRDIDDVSWMKRTPNSADSQDPFL